MRRKGRIPPRHYHLLSDNVMKPAAYFQAAGFFVPTAAAALR